MRRLTHLSLFSGIGGLDLAAEWAGIETVGQCEWAEYPTKVLEKHWPNVPRWKDIKTLTGESFYERTGRRTVDIISGGFPCQPFSVAGKRRGSEDDRFLWPEMVRIIKELRPTWIVGENVAGIVRMALPDILSELETCGYRTRTFLVPACAVGARHRRYRVAIVGYSEHNGLSSPEVDRCPEEASGGQQEGKETACEFEGTGESGNSEVMAYTDSERELQPPGNKQDVRNGIGISGKNVQYSDGTRRKEQYVAAESDKKRLTDRRYNEGDVCNTPGKRLSDRSSELLGGQRTQEQEPERPDSNVSDSDNRLCRWSNKEIQTRGNATYGGSPREWKRTTESILGGMVDGLPGGLDGNLEFFINHYWDEEPDIPRIEKGIEHRVDRLKCLGNAVVPQQFYPVFRAIAEVEGGVIDGCS